MGHDTFPDSSEENSHQSMEDRACNGSTTPCFSFLETKSEARDLRIKKISCVSGNGVGRVWQETKGYGRGIDPVGSQMQTLAEGLGPPRCQEPKGEKISREHNEYEGGLF